MPEDSPTQHIRRSSMVSYFLLLGQQLLFNLLLLACCINAAAASPIDDDLRWLQAFLQRASGQPWSFAASSSSSSSPCGLPQYNGTLPFRMQCSPSSSGEPRITGLMLESMRLHGPFPANTLGNIPFLSHLSLFNNSLQGPLPPELWRLSHLQYLSLSHNLFSGTLPSDLFSLGSLVRLDISGNRLSGSLSAYQFSRLSNLRYLYLSSNAFSGPFPAQILDLPSLLDVNISRNSLQGPLANPATAISTPLSTLDLSFNALSGSLNASLLQQLPFLTNLDLSHNLFTGDASLLLPALPSSLHWLDLSSNKLTGTPSSTISHLPSLSHLGLADNEFSPSSSDWVFSLRQLIYLNLSHGHLQGTISEAIGNLTKLSVLDLSFNELNGSLPLSFIYLHSLTYLDLSRNNLSGDASVLGNLSSLLYLNYSFNNPATGCVASGVRDKFGPAAFEGLCGPFPAEVLKNGTAHGTRSKSHVAMILGPLAGGMLVLCCLVVAGFLCRRTSSPQFLAKRSHVEDKYVSGPFSFETDSGVWLANVKNPGFVPVVILEKPLLNLTFADLLQATSNFSKESQLTEGGFGPVYRANLPGGLDVTIKVLIEGRVLSDQEAADEFRALSKIKHPNLVPLLGYCIVGDERLVIYEHMANGGLHRWLHELPVGTQLDDWSRDLQWEPVEAEMEVLGELGFWDRRHKIALGLARALAFLHHGHSSQIVHRDVKASNVLLDANFEPHLANTGLVGLLAASDEGLFAGTTPGYSPPEYRQPGAKVSTKGDVYSYGVVLLELVTGKRPFGDFYQDGYTGNLVGWVRLLIKDKRGHRALDPRISSDRGPISEMLETLRLGYLCTAEVPSKRPTMQQIVGLLKDMEPNGRSSP